MRESLVQRIISIPSRRKIVPGGFASLLLAYGAQGAHGRVFLALRPVLLRTDGHRGCQWASGRRQSSRCGLNRNRKLATGHNVLRKTNTTNNSIRGPARNERKS